MPYPSTKDTFADPAGTTRVDTGVDHAVLHTNHNNTVEALEDTIGTTAGTNVLMQFAAGQFPLRVTGGAATGTHLTTLVGGSFANPGLIGTPQITGGTWTNPAMIGTGQITGGTVTTANINNPTIGTPAITAGSFNNGVIGTPAITGGTITSTVINPVSSTTAKVLAYQGTAQANFTDNTYQIVNYDSEESDPGGNFAANTFTAPLAGWYFVKAQIGFTAVVANRNYDLAIYKNGTLYSNATEVTGADTADFVMTNVGVVSLATSDTVSIYTRCRVGVSTVDSLAGSTNTAIAIHLLSV